MKGEKENNNNNKNLRRIIALLAGRQERKGTELKEKLLHLIFIYFFLTVLLFGVIDVIDQPEDKAKIYSGRRFSFSPKWRHQ